MPSVDGTVLAAASHTCSATVTMTGGSQRTSRSRVDVGPDPPSVTGSTDAASWPRGRQRAGGRPRHRRPAD